MTKPLENLESILNNPIKVKPKQIFTPQNKVLSNNTKFSQNFYESDQIFQHFFKSESSEAGQQFMEKRLQKLGELAAGEMNELSLTADKEPPTLVKRDLYGETINDIRFHPAYRKLLDIAVQSGMFYVKWQPRYRKQFATERHRLGFAAGFMYAMSESGLYCPLCMTDGVAQLIARYCTSKDKNRLLPYIYTQKTDKLFTGAMFLTEKSGGSDVGANLVRATHYKDDYYLLNGEKWFCSNANAELIFVLARTNPKIRGTKGLSIFLVEKQRPDGSKNKMNIVRLKDKLGVRSMASAEIILTDTVGKMIGKEGEGFKIMADMINLSRLYNSVAALSSHRRALIESYQFLSHRTTFGTNALNHALVRQKLLELGANYVADFYLTWHAIKTLDLAENGDETAQEVIRLLTPMVKKRTAENGVYSIRESMELMGGLGYIEDGVMPKLMRDAMVLPIWEGAGNIMVLDMLRATQKSKGLPMMLKFIRNQFVKLSRKEQKPLLPILHRVVRIAQQLPEFTRDLQEMTAKSLFEELTKLYQIALLLQYKDEQSEAWIAPALDYLIAPLKDSKLPIKHPPTKETVKDLMGWEF